ncbi:MAG: hypothetical protein KKA36_01740 [Gammaproteobacteria bacterium]|nr:hypothetical protein [Gammaproteobacteria bacterium]
MKQISQNYKTDDVRLEYDHMPVTNSGYVPVMTQFSALSGSPVGFSEYGCTA